MLVRIFCLPFLLQSWYSYELHPVVPHKVPDWLVPHNVQVILGEVHCLPAQDAILLVINDVTHFLASSTAAG